MSFELNSNDKQVLEQGRQKEKPKAPTNQ